MYTELLYTHSLLRYFILAVLLIALLKSIGGWMQKTQYNKLDNGLAFWTMLLVHLQIIIGLGLYFVSPKVILDDMATTMANSALRYYTVEHVLMMIIVAALITVGRIGSKKKVTDLQKHKSIAIYYGLSLFLIIVTVYVMMPV